jgi:hypothetical protein
LYVFWVDGEGGWSAPLRIAWGGNGIYNAPMGSHIALSNQFGVSIQTDLFMMNTAPGGPSVSPALGWPTVCWVLGSGAWNGPSALVLEV